MRLSTEFTKDSINKVEEGTKLADTTKKATEEIVEFSKKTRDIVTTINQDAKTQVEASENIVASIEQVKVKTDEIKDASMSLEEAGKTISAKVEESKNYVDQVISAGKEQLTTMDYINEANIKIKEKMDETIVNMEIQSEQIKSVVADVNNVNIQIDETVHAITEQKVVAEGLMEINQAIVDISEENSNISKEVVEMSEELKEIVKTLEAETNKYSVDKDLYSIMVARAQHNAYLGRFKGEIAINDTIDINKFADNRNCAFGKWFYTEGKKYAKFPYLKEIDKLHKNIHDKIQEGIDCHNKGAYKERNTAIKSAEELSKKMQKFLIKFFEDVSNEIYGYTNV